MKSAKLAFLVLAILGLACQEPTQPRDGSISGVVRYPSGSPVNRAKVGLNFGGGADWNHLEMFSDSLGRYEFVVNAVGDSANVLARDGYNGGMISGRHVGWVVFVVRERIVEQDIVLKYFEPI